MNLALVILNRQRIFKENIQAWKRTNQAYKIWDNFKHNFREAHLELKDTGVTIDKLGLHNDNVIVDQMMARLQIYEDESTGIATQHATKLASVNQTNATMESEIHTLLTQVQALQLSNTQNNGNNYGRRRGRGRGLGSGRGRGPARPSALPTPKY